MHKEFKRLLENATGESERVIVVIIDIRGFSPFCKDVDSADVALFVRKVYTKLIDEYFPNASFFKSTGDGLLITVRYTEENLKEVATNTMISCLKALKDFPSLCAGDHMINFPVPQMIGIGLSRGAVCRLVSRGKILDYSGRALNLASRLMDLARPSGIVFDANFGIGLFPDEVVEQFSKDNVFIKGLAEITPIEIYLTKRLTEIPYFHKKPLKKFEWRTVKFEIKTRDLAEISARVFALEKEPLDPTEIRVKIYFPQVVKGRRRKGTVYIDYSEFKYYLEAETPKLEFPSKPLIETLRSYQVKDDWTFTLAVLYPI